MTRSLPLPLIRALHRFTSSTANAYHYFDAFAAETMVAVVPQVHWHELTVSLYSENRLLYSVHHESRLFRWEEAVVAAHFPGAPARILVGAAGNGRELIQLAKRGYEVAGFDPSERAISRARQRIGDGRLLALEVGSYRDLAEGRLERIQALAPYDAVLLGWGSMAHVHDREEQRALFRMVRRLCPLGPVAFSWIRRPPEGAHRAAFRRVLAQAGFRRSSEAHHFRALVGFFTVLSASDVAELADATGYRLVEQSEEGPHAVFRPVDGSGRD